MKRRDFLVGTAASAASAAAVPIRGRNVAAPFAPVPASPALEKQFLPDKERIVEAARKTVAQKYS